MAITAGRSGLRTACGIAFIVVLACRGGAGGGGGCCASDEEFCSTRPPGEDVYTCTDVASTNSRVCAPDEAAAIVRCGGGARVAHDCGPAVDHAGATGGGDPQTDGDAKQPVDGKADGNAPPPPDDPAVDEGADE